MGSGDKGRLKTAAVIFAGVAFFGSFVSSGSIDASARPAPRATPTPQPQVAVIPVTVISAERAAATLRALFPHARVSVDRHANAVVVVASPDDLQQMRTVIQGIDVKNPQTPQTQVISLHVLKPSAILGRLRELYPNAHIEVASKTTLLVRAVPQDLTEITALVGSLDVAPPTAAPTVQPEDTVQVTQANPRTVARTLVREVPDLRASVSGGTIILVGSSDSIQKAKTLAQQLDGPGFNAKYTQIYHLHNIDATSVGDLVQRSFPSVKVTVDKDLNALSVLATAADQQRIATAINQLDAAQQSGASGGGGGAAYGDGNIDVVNLKSAIPGQQGTPSTTASDIAQAVQQSLGSLAPDLHLTPLPSTSQIVLAGNPQSIRLARELIDKLDMAQPLVALDTEVLEVDENVARNLGIEVPGGYISTIYSEIEPTPDPLTGQPPKIGRFQGLTRTPISFPVLLNFLVQKGNGRVLADPRVTTVSGRTANITAGDQFNFLIQTGGGITPISQTLQQIQTGITLDITPIVNGDGTITVAVHPDVRSVAGIGAQGLPDVAERQATTVVQLKDNDTLVIGGLIQEENSRVVTKIPILGDIPLLGKLFQNSNVSSTRNELIIAVTPHVIRPGETGPPPNAVLPIPTPRALPTLPPGTSLPASGVPTPRPEPSPTIVPTPILTTPVPTMTPQPVPVPTAFEQTNVFTFGSPPPNTFAQPSDAARIFFAQYSPTILHDNTPVHVFAVTSSNVKRVTIGYPGHETQLTQVAPSKWQADYNFSTFGVPLSSSVNLILSAYTAFGATASVQIPVSVLSP